MRQRARDAAAASEPASAQASAVPASTDPGGRGPLAAEVRDPRHRGPRGHAADRQGPLLHRHHARAARSCSTRSPNHEGRLSPQDPGGRGRAGQHLLRGPVVPRRRHGDRDGWHGGSPEGLKTIFTFDPITETWRQRASMRHGRWYPTQVLLADGRTVVMDGLDEQGEPHVNPQIESYTPNIDFVTLLSVRGQTGQPPSGGLYPAPLPDAERPRARRGARADRQLVLQPQPDRSPVLLEELQSHRHTWGTGVLIPSGSTAGSTRVALIAGVDRDSLPDTGTSTPLAGVETFDEANPGAGWAPAPLAQRRTCAPEHRPVCRTARWQPSAAATGS